VNKYYRFADASFHVRHFHPTNIGVSKRHLSHTPQQLIGAETKYHDLPLLYLSSLLDSPDFEMRLGLSSGLLAYGDMPRIDIIRSGELGEGYSTEGIIRRKAFEFEKVIVSQSQVAPGGASGWHHHGTRHLYGYIVSGRLQLEYVLEGREIADLNAEDFFHVPPRIVHRDINPHKDRELFVVNILVGSGPAVVNINSPTGED
jgi:quercetin dioxygenase-like cupin family protein